MFGFAFRTVVGTLHIGSILADGGRRGREELLATLGPHDQARVRSAAARTVPSVRAATNGRPPTARHPQTQLIYASGGVCGAVRAILSVGSPTGARSLFRLESGCGSASTFSSS